MDPIAYSLANSIAMTVDAVSTLSPTISGTWMVWATIGSDIYYGLGQSNSSSTGSDGLYPAQHWYKFNVKTQTITQLAPWTYQQSLFNATAFAIGQSVYVAGGYYLKGASSYSSKATYCYNTVTDTWSQVADLPDKLIEIGSCVIDGKGYVGGGMNQTNTTITNLVVYCYDPTSDIWTKSAANPSSMYSRWGWAFARNGIVYVGNPSQGIFPYDPKANTWGAKLPTIPSTGLNSSLVYIPQNDRCYTVGNGYAGGWYDFKSGLTGTLTTPSNSTYETVTTVIGQDIYHFAGYTGSVSSTAVLKYTPQYMKGRLSLINYLAFM